MADCGTGAAPLSETVGFPDPYIGSGGRCSQPHFLAGWLIFLLVATTHLALLTDANDWILRLLQLAGVGGMVGSILVLVNSLHAWKDPGRGFWAKIGNTVLVLACLATIWFAVGFHLLSVTLEY